VICLLCFPNINTLSHVDITIVLPLFVNIDLLRKGDNVYYKDLIYVLKVIDHSNNENA